jgi:hypothetical protein
MSTQDKTDTLSRLIQVAWNQAAINKAGDNIYDVEHVGDVLTIEEMNYFAQQATDYFCEMTGFNPNDIERKTSGETPLDFVLEMTLTERPPYDSSK